MISSAHILTGAAIGLLIDRQVDQASFSNVDFLALGLGVFLLAVISHHLMDMMPHTDAGSFRIVGDDGPLTRKERLVALVDNMAASIFVLVVFFLFEPSLLMLIGSFGANFPDVWHHFPAWRKITRTKILPFYYWLHDHYHWTARGRLVSLGIILNLIFIVLPIVYLLG